MRFPLVRTTVTLSLIVALAIQPMMAQALMPGCGADGFTCEGCGCCEVENATDSCGCCGGGPESLRDTASRDRCCEHPSGDHGAAEKASRADIRGNQRSSITASAETENLASAASSRMLQACSCEQQSQPLSDTSSRRTSSESRPTVAVGYTAFDASSLGDPPARSAEHQHAVRSTPQHFAQALLCIWRL